MKVFNLQSPRSGNPVANQFLVIEDDGTQIFQSYRTDIVKITPDKQVHISKDWTYSRTTKKYCCAFLGLTGRQIESKIEDGTFKIWNR